MAAEVGQRAAVARTRVMSCDATVMVLAAPSAPDDGAALARSGARRLAQLEQRWSRFLPNSEISSLNRSGGARCTVSGDTIRLTRELVRSWFATSGAFDPTLLGALVELGYAASRDDQTVRTSLPGAVAMRGEPGRILVDERLGVVQLPAGTALDPGGLGKGLAADVVTEELLASGATGALVEIGGDVRVAGTPPDGDAWTISVAPAFEGGRTRIVRLRDGGVATSSSRLRTWRRNGEIHHHLVDPNRLACTDGDVVAATVIAGSAAWAEAFTKVAFVEGISAALRVYADRGLAASVTSADASTHESDSWTAFHR